MEILPTSGISNPFTYTGRELDTETGLYYYRARYYDSSAGRFISEDPIGFLGGGVNFYGYVLNNPIIFIDPSGLQCSFLQEATNFILDLVPKDIIHGEEELTLSTSIVLGVGIEGSLTLSRKGITGRVGAGIGVKLNASATVEEVGRITLPHRANIESGFDVTAIGVIGAGPLIKGGGKIFTDSNVGSGRGGAEVNLGAGVGVGFGGAITAGAFGDIVKFDEDCECPPNDKE